MKFNDFKNKNLEEGFWGNMLDRFQGDTATIARNEFVKKFFQKVYTDLDSAITGGMVDPDSTIFLGQQARPQTPTQPQAQTAAPQQGQALDLDAYKQRRDQERAAGAQAQKDAMAQMQQTAAANKATSAADNELVARVKAEKLKPGFQQNKGLLRQAAARGIHESKYDVLNNIFESILNEQNEDGTMSISQYLYSWVDKYSGLDFNANPETGKRLIALINDVQKSYKQDKARDAMNKLANAVYALSFQGKTTAPTYNSAATAPQGKNYSAEDFSTQLVNLMQAFAQKYPREFAMFKQQMNKP